MGSLHRLVAHNKKVLSPRGGFPLLEDITNEERADDSAARPGMGHVVPDCPLGLKVCYPSCYWFKEGKCSLDEEEG